MHTVTIIYFVLEEMWGCIIYWYLAQGKGLLDLDY